MSTIKFVDFVNDTTRRIRTYIIVFVFILVLLLLLFIFLVSITNYIRFLDALLNNAYSYVSEDVKRITSDILYYDYLIISSNEINVDHKILRNYFAEYVNNNNTLSFESFEVFKSELLENLPVDYYEKISKNGFYLERKIKDKAINFVNYIKVGDRILVISFSYEIGNFIKYIYIGSTDFIDSIGIVYENRLTELFNRNNYKTSLNKLINGFTLPTGGKISVGLNNIFYSKSIKLSWENSNITNNLELLGFIGDKTYLPLILILTTSFSLIVFYTTLYIVVKKMSNKIVKSVSQPIAILENEIQAFANAYYFDVSDGFHSNIQEIQNIRIAFQKAAETISAHVEELYATNLELEKTYHELEKYVSKSEEAYFYFVSQLANISEGYDEVTGNHIDRVGVIAEFMAKKIGLSNDTIEKISKFACLHDVGKILIPKKILMKAGPLTENEFEIMKLHTVIGAAIIGESDYFETARLIALYHHEKYDGTGYPFGLKGDEIPIEAQIVGLADIYDALRSDRPYKKGFSHYQTVEIIIKGDKRLSPNSFNPNLLKIFTEYSYSIESLWEKVNDENKNKAKNTLFELLGEFLDKIQKYDLLN